MARCASWEEASGVGMGPWSKTVTLWPRRSSAQAAESPMMPAPMMETFMCGSPRSIVPAHPVAFGEGDRGGGSPGSGREGAGPHIGGRPAGGDAVDPLPLRLHLVAAHEQCGITLDQAEQQPLIGDAPARLREHVGD